ncbi:acetate kinase [Rhizobium sp. Root708]|uniref:acetate/propionate family kinase n=1 Tax=Rhizobium sp. Root708 TaxID=1736592 RepID=UPI0006FE3B80|nr:acetate kinase [Rhizobium sp. Root708]KRB62176.1 acetate kinase [Rhizobium sp. Root708]
MDTILVVNAGSSSLKFEVFAVAGSLERLVKGQMEGIGTTPHLTIRSPSGERLENETYPADVVPDLPAAMRLVGELLRQRQAGRLIAVGHRVVRGHDPMTDHYAIPARFFDEGVRRYGFHGLSYEYVAGRLAEISPGSGKGRVIVAHLGSGASMCALYQGMSVESTLGFTALDGLPMGTRCGQIDPGVLLYLLQQHGMSAGQLQDLLYKESGLKGLSGVSNDVRVLLASEEAGASLALDHFVHRIGLNAGALAAALGGLDAFVFTAGVGENSPVMRARIARKLEWLGASLDPARNEAGELVISSGSSKIPIFVVPTDEELMIARHTLALIAA